jgi:hypothetical protein
LTAEVDYLKSLYASLHNGASFDDGLNNNELNSTSTLAIKDAMRIRPTSIAMNDVSASSQALSDDQKQTMLSAVASTSIEDIHASILESPQSESK